MSKIIEDFKNYCSKQGERVTPPRLHMLEIITSAPKPLTACDALEALAQKLDNPKPPTAYRALDFLAAHGFIHRIESLNAYVACGENHKHKGAQFIICDECGAVEEIHLCSIPEALKKQAGNKGFTLSHWNAELHGLCDKCA
jgi:Fur family zinc uptake transcriptional regulator